jgi:hypothetical protein
MLKKGNLASLAFIIVLFLLFLALKSFNITGYVIQTPGFNINEISFFKLESLSNGSFLPNDETFFNINDTVGCYINYTSTDITTVNLSLGIYSFGTTENNPEFIFNDILNVAQTNVVCKENVCLAYAINLTYKSGDWKCFAKLGSDYEFSKKLEMKNSPPYLTQDIPEIILNLNGSYATNKIDLDNFYSDAETNNADFIYGVIGASNIKPLINNNGEVTFTNPNNFQGIEILQFRAFDGEIGTFSNNVTVRVGTGETPVECTSIWDCSWETCVNGIQTCSYVDKNNCGTIQGKPSDLTRECVLTTNGEVQAKSKTVPLNLKPVNKEVSSLDGSSRTLTYVGIVIMVLGIIGFGVYLFLHKKSVTPVVQNKSAEKTAEKQSNPNDISSYIEDSLRKGITEQEIVKSLLTTGWQKKDIDNAINYVKLKSFVAHNLKSGFDKEKITTSLKSKGWKQDMIDRVFKDLKV